MKNLSAALGGPAAGTTMHVLTLILLLVASPAFAQDSQLAGNRKLVAFQSILDNDPPKDLYGAHPTVVTTVGGATNNGGSQ